MNRAERISLLLALVAVLAVGTLRTARADTGNTEIDKGVALYNDLEFESAIDVLEQALAQPGLSTEEATEGYVHLALSYLALDQKDKARVALKKLIEAAPRYELPRTVSQEALDIFAELKAEMPPPQEEVAPARISQSATPLAPRVGAAITITAIVVDPDQRHSQVVIYHRVRGTKSYSEVKALSTAIGRYAATISGQFVKPPALEYYVAALDKKGNLVASEGSAKHPFALKVEEGKKGAAPIYAKWWFWGAIGAVAAGTVAILTMTGGGSPDPDATVTITVDYP